MLVHIPFLITRRTSVEGKNIQVNKSGVIISYKTNTAQPTWILFQSNSSS